MLPSSAGTATPPHSHRTGQRLFVSYRSWRASCLGRRSMASLRIVPARFTHSISGAWGVAGDPSWRSAGRFVAARQAKGVRSP